MNFRIALATCILALAPAFALAIPITSTPSDSTAEPGTPFRHNLFHDAAGGASGAILSWFDLDTSQSSDWNPNTGALTLYVNVFSDSGLTNQIGSAVATSNNLFGAGFGDFDGTSLGYIDWVFFDLASNVVNTAWMEFFDNTHPGDSQGNIPNTYVNNTVTLWGAGDDDGGNSLGVDLVFTVPEPAILLLMAMGLLGIGVSTRRRK